AAGVPYASVEILCLHLVFLDGGGVGQIGGGIAVAHVGNAIDGPVVSADIAGIVRFGRTTEGVDAVIASIAARLDARYELDQHQRAVVEGGQVHYAAVVHHPSGADAARVQQRGLGCHGDAFGRLAHFEPHVDLGSGAERQDYARADRFLET